MDQNDIDALLGDSGDSGEGDSSGDTGGSAPQEDSGELSQADIDAALNGGASESSGELTQADIDAALSGAGGSSGGGSSEDAGVSMSGGGVSQDDIDALLGVAGMDTSGSAGEAAPAPADDRVDSSGRPFDAVAAAMADAIAEEKAAAAAQSPPPVSDSVRAQDLELPTFDQDDLAAEAKQAISMLHDVDLNVKIELGRTEMLVEDVLRLNEGSVVELEKLAGDPVDLFVNDRLVARGEVLVLNDNFCVRVSEIVSDPDTRKIG